MANPKFNKYGMPSDWSRSYHLRDRYATQVVQVAEPAEVAAKATDLANSGFKAIDTGKYAFMHRGVKISVKLSGKQWIASNGTLGLNVGISIDTSAIDMASELSRLVEEYAPGWMLK